ncbi:MAG: hypothetical protein HC898_10285 [Phycisphaerales bacterium]|nr:hypothetical protein [Phycisphaerales bacterium]
MHHHIRGFPRFNRPFTNGTRRRVHRCFNKNHQVHLAHFFRQIRGELGYLSELDPLVLDPGLQKIDGSGTQSIIATLPGCRSL